MILKANADSIGAKVGIDPLTVLAFLSAVLPILMQCFESDPDRAAEHFRQDTKATRRQIRLACNRQWRKEHGVDAPKKLVIEVQHRMAMATGEQMRALYVQD